jgi:cytochrome P450
VTFLLGAANRDPDVFVEPERFDMQRQPNRHLAFGFGRHFCIGAELARVEARIAFPMILRQLPHLQWAGEEVQWHAAFGIRSLESLPVVTQ